MPQIDVLMRLMQSHDPNGTWTEWAKEIARGESAFSADYVRETLQAWYDDSENTLYLRWMDLLQ